MAEVRDSQDIDGKTNFDVGGKPLLIATSHLIYPCGADLPNNCYPWMIGKKPVGYCNIPWHDTGLFVTMDERQASHRTRHQQCHMEFWFHDLQNIARWFWTLWH